MEIPTSPPIADILIVDDTPENLRLLSAMLSQEGYKVRQAINGTIALNAVRRLAPDLILLDIMMPELNGYEVCQALKADAKTEHIPIIFLSALDDIFDKVKAFSVGGIDFINKPFQIQEVLIRVKSQLDLKIAKQNILRLNAELEQRVQKRTQELEMANAQLKKMAMQDALTALPNRVFFMEQLNDLLQALHTGAGQGFALLFLDCDRFKVVNDSLGHPTGDELLICLARHLEDFLKPRDTLARLGGDEFAILVTEIQDIDDAVDMAKAILDSFTQPFKIQGREIFLSASIGIAEATEDYTQPEYLLRDADSAMYRAKALGKSCHYIFHPSLHAEAVSFLQIETDLRRAIAGEEFVVYYQPIVNLASGTISGFEALLRWQHPQRGLLSPLNFIPIAEETGLIAAIGSYALHQACQQLREWQERDLAARDLAMNVNLSVRQFANQDLIEQIDCILRETHLDATCLKLEITESVIMDNQTALTLLRSLRDRNIQICLDDFGTGYSSLSYLHRFPINALKIDKSFINRWSDSHPSLGLVPVIINIARTMKLDTVAEGIETREQFEGLKNLDCNFGQGYFFARPLNAMQATELLKSFPRWD
ncbi:MULTISPECIES: EAL domain-containing protein [Spirulina sp. CCY15215]|uniref:putative bifunctional diguanylate cyclase/phosphodiesterase n=1 Tax=Spirulina sp. CCY15215 TaxID=2767591 RepID=UPI0032AEDCAC